MSEGERRLRATVRALLSRGVWAIVGAQFGLILLWRRVLSADEAPSFELVLLAVAVAGFFYLTAGVSQALADSRDLIGFQAPLRAGAKCYGPFLWMVAKLVLLTGVLLNVAVYLGSASGTPPPAGGMSQRVPGLLPLLQGVLSFVFVYWLPIVFVRGNFALIKTLTEALVMAWRRLSQSAYLAFLTLAPAFAAAAAGDSMPPAGAVLISLASGVMEWIAYAYCVGYLQDQAVR